MKIVKFPDKSEELKHTSYTDNEGDLGISTLCKSISVERLNNKDFLICTKEGSTVMDREVLAEFLHVAAVFVDSEKRYYPELDLIGCDY